jgi:hypothetical protein
MPGVLSFYDPAPPAPAQTRGVGFEIIVEVAGGSEGAAVVVTLNIDGTFHSTEIAVISGGVGYAYFDEVVLNQTSQATLNATATGMKSASMNVPVVDP